MCFRDRSSHEQWAIATSLSGRSTFQSEAQGAHRSMYTSKADHGRYVMCATTALLKQEREGRTAVLGG
jgi:hypothetical protein